MQNVVLKNPLSIQWFLRKVAEDKSLDPETDWGRELLTLALPKLEKELNVLQSLVGRLRKVLAPKPVPEKPVLVSSKKPVSPPLKVKEVKRATSPVRSKISRRRAKYVDVLKDYTDSGETSKKVDPVPAVEDQCDDRDDPYLHDLKVVLKSYCDSVRNIHKENSETFTAQHPRFPDESTDAYIERVALSLYELDNSMGKFRNVKFV